MGKYNFIVTKENECVEVGVFSKKYAIVNSGWVHLYDESGHDLTELEWNAQYERADIGDRVIIDTTHNTVKVLKRPKDAFKKLLFNMNVNARRVSVPEYNKIVEHWKSIRRDAIKNAREMFPNSCWVEYPQIESSDKSAFIATVRNVAGIPIAKTIVYTKESGILELLPYLEDGYICRRLG